MKKEDNLKDQFKQALISTIKVISEEYKTEINLKKNLSSKNYNFFELDNLSSKQDYIKIRAQENFLIKKFIKKIFPKVKFIDLFTTLLKKLGMKCCAVKCLEESQKI